MSAPTSSDEDVARWAVAKLTDSRLMSLPRDLMGVVMLHVNEMHNQEPRYKDMCALWTKMEVRICNRCGAHSVSYEAAMNERTCEMNWCGARGCEVDLCVSCENGVCAYCHVTYCDRHAGYMHTCKGCNRMMCNECRDRSKTCEYCNELV